MRTLYPIGDLPANESGWTFEVRLRESEKLALNELSDLQTTHLRSLLAHHGENTPQFQKRLQWAGLTIKDLDNLKTLSLLPPFQRSDIQKAGQSLFSAMIPFDHLPAQESRTSGSTGEPVVIRRTRINSLLNEAATLRDHRWWNRPHNGGRITMIRPQFEQLREVPATANNTANIAQQIPIGTDLLEQTRLIAAFQPQVLLIYPSNLAGLLDLWEVNDDFPRHLRHLKTVGETVSIGLRDRVHKLLNLPIEDGYSSEEMGAMAIQCPASGLYHVMGESHWIEVLNDDGAPCERGQVGRVVVTDLHNLATPMIRYQIGDWAEVGGPCPCGRNLPTLKRILGRERNLVRLPNGQRHWPLVGFARFAEVAPIRQYQVIQESFTDVELRIVVDTPLPGAQHEALARIVSDSLGHPFRVRVSEYPDQLPLGANGKFEEFVCKVASHG